jgi:hypothetical protein
MKLEFPLQIFEKTQEPNFMKILSVRDELFYGDRWTDKHGEANSGVSQFCENAYKLHSRRNPELRLFLLATKQLK